MPSDVKSWLFVVDRSAHQCMWIRTDAALDQDCGGLKATMSVRTPCNVVSLPTTSVDFNTPPLTMIAPLMQDS